MTFAKITLFVTQLLLPVALIVSLWTGTISGKHPSRASWLAGVLGSGAFISYFLLTGRWDWVSYFLRVALFVAYLCALCVSFRKTIGDHSALRWHPPGSLRGWYSLAANTFLVLFFGALIVLAALGFGYGDLRAAKLSFPLRSGVYYVAQGGNSPLLNYHNTNRAQRFALDIVELGAAGTRAVGIQPSDPSRYAIFRAGIHSPCAGEVTEAADGRPDLRPPESDREYPAGNHVVVRCAEEDVDVELAHMKEGSVAVERGEHVEEGRLLGRVGNTGNTSEPHLHVHAVRTGSGSTSEGEGVPILFDGRFLVRNSLVFRQ